MRKFPEALEALARLNPSTPPEGPVGPSGWEPCEGKPNGTCLVCGLEKKYIPGRLGILECGCQGLEWKLVEGRWWLRETPDTELN